MRDEPNTRAPIVNAYLFEDVRKLAKRIKEVYDSQEFQAFWQPAKIALKHEKQTFLHPSVHAWAEERIGCRPDFVIGAHLRKKELGDATPRETWMLVDDRGEKLRGVAKGEADDLAIAVFSEKCKSYPRLIRALSESADRHLEIERAIRIAGAESRHGYPLTLGAIEWRIHRDNRWRDLKGTPGEDSPIVKDARIQVRAAEARAFGGRLKPQEHRDAVRALRKAEEGLEKVRTLASPMSLSAVGSEEGMVELEDDGSFLPSERLLDRLFLAHYASAENPARMSPGEREVFRLALHLEHKEIAKKTGRTENQVRQEKHRAARKVRAHARIRKFS